MQVHPSAIIDPGVQIGEGTRIWHFCHLMTGSIVGKNCILGQNVYVDRDCTIGDRVKIQNNVSVYKGVKLEDDVFVGPSVVFTNVINPRSFIERKSEFKPTLVRKGASIGANATILCGIEIGSFAMVGAGAVVTKTVNPYEVITGNPGKRSGWVSEAGANLNFGEDTETACTLTGQHYQLKNHSVSRLD